MKKVLLVLSLLLVVTGCNRKNKYDGVVNVLNWSSYIPDSVIKDFEKEYNIKVNYGTYSSNEELLAKVTSSKNGTYDVIFPSDYMVEILKEKDLIKKLDKKKIPNYKNVDKLFLNQYYDKNNEYSIPFLATIVVIAVNNDNISEEINGYKDLTNPEYKNNIVLIDDQRDIIGLALLALGYDMNSTNDEELKEAKEWLLKFKNNIKAYDSDSPKTFFLTNEADIGIMWNAEAELAKEKNENIEIVYPSEGHAISVDNYTIMKGSKNEDNGYLFINYLLNKKVGRKIVEEYPYISPLKIKQVSKIDKENVFENGYYVTNIGPKIRDYDKLWADVK